jgi:hypothetical protein
MEIGIREEHSLAIEHSKVGVVDTAAGERDVAKSRPRQQDSGESAIPELHAKQGCRLKVRSREIAIVHHGVDEPNSPKRCTDEGRPIEDHALDGDVLGVRVGEVSMHMHVLETLSF